MSSRFKVLVESFRKRINLFDEQSNEQQLILLLQLASKQLPQNESLIRYFDVLLFICAYPPDAKTLGLAEKELERITRFLRTAKKREEEPFLNSGLPFTPQVSNFSHDFIQWLLTLPKCEVGVSHFDGASFDLNAVLALTLPSVLRGETTADLGNLELLDALRIGKKEQVRFLLSELSKLNHIPLVKDHLYDGLGLHVLVRSKDRSFSRAYNRLDIAHVFYHSDLLKRFDHDALLNQTLPAPARLSVARKKQAINVVKTTMALVGRETDPTTYMDERSFRLYELERGISIAIYGMTLERQLPLESYVGYTLFKNGFPAAYGGSWVFGRYANFGINIFDAFRGGESGFILCQLLRVYRQVFGVCYFEIEAYQFGLDNPEGIESGAFWFYHRYGFRPIDKDLLRLSKGEKKRLERNKSYRTSKAALIRFTQSNMALNLEKKIPISPQQVSSRIGRMITQTYQNDAAAAVRESVLEFRKKTGLNQKLNMQQAQVLEEVALWAEAFGIDDKLRLGLMKNMTKVKPTNLYEYQRSLLEF